MSRIYLWGNLYYVDQAGVRPKLTETERGQQRLLCGSEDVLKDGFTVFFVTHHDSSLPAAILPFAHHAVPGWSAFCHLLCTSVPNVAVIVIQAFGHDPDPQPEAQDEILPCRNAVDFML